MPSCRSDGVGRNTAVDRLRCRFRPLRYGILAGTQVLVDGVAAALYYVSPAQVKFIVPPHGGQSLTVVSGHLSSPATPVTIGLWAPDFSPWTACPPDP